MGTNPVTPITLAKLATPSIQSVSWLKAHEKIIITLIFAALLWFGISRTENVIAQHDNVTLQKATLIAKQTAVQNATLAAQVAQQAIDMKNLAARLEAQNVRLEQANIALATSLTTQQKTDATLPPTELIARLNALVPTAEATTSPTGVSLPQVGAVTVVQQLEEVPVLKTQLSNTTEQLTNKSTLLTTSQAQITTLNTEVAGLQTQITENTKVCQAQMTTLKAEARKSKRRWFGAGFIFGFLGREAIKVETGF